MADLSSKSNITSSPTKKSSKQRTRIRYELFKAFLKHLHKPLHEHRVMINALDVLPNPTNTGRDSNSDTGLKTIVLCGNHLGLIRVIGVYS